MRTILSTTVCAAPFILAAVTAAAGEGNKVYLLQDGNALPGNNLWIDQSSATGSLVAGISGDDLSETLNGVRTGTPADARQIGGGNTADITLSGRRPTVLLDQKFTGTLDNPINSATLSGGTLSSIVLQQEGFGNTGEITVTGVASTGILQQIGNGNTGAVTIEGRNTTGTLIQSGNNNSVPLTVSGNGANVTYTLEASGVVMASPPEVYSNGGTVTITQTQWGSN